MVNDATAREVNRAGRWLVGMLLSFGLAAAAACALDTYALDWAERGAACWALGSLGAFGSVACFARAASIIRAL